MLFQSTPCSQAALLFENFARVSFGNVDWRLVISVLLAKLLLVVLGVGFSWLITRRADGTGFAYTLGGVFALLSTMSDDMGIGLPIFSAFITKNRDQAIMHSVRGEYNCMDAARVCNDRV